MYIAGKVTGVTYLDSTMYVVCARSSKIWSYDTATYRRLDDIIDVEGMKDPSDVVTCVVDRQLFVADWSSGAQCIWRVSLDDQEGRSSKLHLLTHYCMNYFMI